jgi:superfamily II helicase
MYSLGTTSSRAPGIRVKAPIIVFEIAGLGFSLATNREDAQMNVRFGSPSKRDRGDFK